MNVCPIDINTLWDISATDFVEKAMQLSQWQQSLNPIYQQWVALVNKDKAAPLGLSQIPFLPISFFKSHDLYIGEKPTHHFESSGTTEDVVSKHWVKELSIYEQSFRHCFKLFYGDIKEYCILGLLPSYLERRHSSLVYMVEQLIHTSAHPLSGFYLYDFEKLNQTIKRLELQGQKTILIGVSFALLDFAAAFPQQLKHTIVIETGGMKGRKDEMTKQALHTYLSQQFDTNNIQSEYGMTELLSQAYAIQNGLFKCPPWMKILVGDEQEPGNLQEKGRGLLHVIDLANMYSCAFIETQDRIELFEDGCFQVLGRSDNSDRRGCSLLVV